MLVLARRLNQSIMIGNDIEVVIVDIKGEQVKIGIKAPKNVSVHRTEVHKEIEDQNVQATKTKINPVDLKNISELLKKKKEEE
jgi:carbon storage regulator